MDCLLARGYGILKQSEDWGGDRMIGEESLRLIAVLFRGCASPVRQDAPMSPDGNEVK